MDLEDKTRLHLFFSIFRLIKLGTGSSKYVIYYVVRVNYIIFRNAMLLRRRGGAALHRP